VVAVLGGESKVSDAFKAYVDTIFPFNKKHQDDKDGKMKEVMDREVKKGAITFNPVAMDFLKNKTKTMSLPDDFQQRLRDRSKYGRKIEP
jgi:hypothetical protein